VVERAEDGVRGSVSPAGGGWSEGVHSLSVRSARNKRLHDRPQRPLHDVVRALALGGRRWASRSKPATSRYGHTSIPKYLWLSPFQTSRSREVAVDHSLEASGKAFRKKS